MLRKGISPLIATVLLIAFSMTLGAIVMNFSQTSTHELKDKAADQMERGLTCSLDLAIRVLEINGEKFICYNRSGSNNLEVIVENQGSANAQGVKIFLLDDYDNIKSENVLIPLGGHNRTKYNISINETDDNTVFVFPPSQIVISPIIEYSSAGIDICTDNRIEIDEIEVCE